MGFDDGPDPLALGLFQAFGGEAEPGGDLLFAANPLVELVVGFHASRLTSSPVAVQQTGRLRACSWSNATRTPYPGGTPGACRVVRGNPLCLQGRRPSPCSNRVGFHIGLFRGLHGVHSRCGLPARRTAEAARCLEGFDGFVTSAAAPIATGWSDQLSGRESHPLETRAFARRTASGTPSRPAWSPPDVIPLADSQRAEPVHVRHPDGRPDLAAGPEERPLLVGQPPDRVAAELGGYHHVESAAVGPGLDRAGHGGE